LNDLKKEHLKRSGNVAHPSYTRGQAQVRRTPISEAKMNREFPETIDLNETHLPDSSEIFFQMMIFVFLSRRLGTFLGALVPHSNLETQP
jgi:predicted deacylase